MDDARDDSREHVSDHASREVEVPSIGWRYKSEK
jgi:hypothetical protein